MKHSDILNLIKEMPVAVLGLGVSNIPLVEFLLSRGARITAYDRKNREELCGLAEELEAKGVTLVLGENYLDNVKENLIFRTPGIRPDSTSLPEAAKRGAIITSEMELFIELTEASVIAVTGSDGKTTTTTLTHLFLDEQKKRDGKGYAYVGGNIGTPLLPKTEVMTKNDIAVLELSSFQLMGMKQSPSRAAITNITENHLNWHIDMAEYTAAKQNICGDNTRLVVINADDKISSELAFGEDIEVRYFSSTKSSFDEIVPSNNKNVSAIFIRNGKIVFAKSGKEEELLELCDIKLRGRHNVENYMTAIALSYGLVDIDIYQKIAKSFGGVEHRLEFVAEVDGVKYYNSSIDSTPTRSAAALSALDEKPIVICGGSDKGVSFEPLAEVLCQRASAVILNGETAEKIATALESYASDKKPEIYKEENLGRAIDRAVSIARSGDTVLLSPACASFDQFKNFDERGKFFKNSILSLGRTKINK